jgi:hypothetical protein
MNLDETNRIIRTMVQHEDGLREQRLGWLLTLNGLLFASLGFAWDEDGIEALGWVSAGLGIALGLVAVGSMLVSNCAISHLDAEFERLAGEELSTFPPVRGMTSDIMREEGGIYRFLPKLYIWNLVPWALVVAWSSVLGAMIYNKVT